MAKDRRTELVAQLRDAARMQDPAARACIELVRLLLDETKDTLVTTDGQDMVRAQGAARQLAKLLRDLTTQPPNINPQPVQER